MNFTGKFEEKEGILLAEKRFFKVTNSRVIVALIERIRRRKEFQKREDKDKIFK